MLYVTGKLKKVFPSIVVLLRRFCFRVHLVKKHQQFLESSFANDSNDKTSRFVASKVLSKGSKVGVFIWRLSSIFDPGLCVLVCQSKLSILPPVSRPEFDMKNHILHVSSTSTAFPLSI